MLLGGVCPVTAGRVPKVNLYPANSFDYFVSFFPLVDMDEEE